MELFVLIFTLFLLAGCLCLKRYQHFKIFEIAGIPGPRPSLIWGNLLELRSSPLKVLNSWKIKYGPVFGYFAGSRPMLVIGDLDMSQQVLVKDALKAFQDRPTMLVPTEPVSDTLAGLTGERWRQVRYALSPIFRPAILKRLNSTMSHCVANFVSGIEKKKASESSGFHAEIDVWTAYEELTCEIISKCLLETEENDPKLVEATRGFMRNAISPMVLAAICFPSVGKVAGKLIKVFGLSHRMTQMIIKNVSHSLNTCGNEGVLHLLLDAGNLTEREIIANCWAFILAGFETTASALTFSTFLIAQHPDVQEKLYSELRNSFPEDGELKYEDIMNLPYMNQVVSECLRLYPPIPTFVSRKLSCPLRLGRFDLPEGINVQIPVWEIHRDPTVWTEPEKFIPERFERKRKHPMAYLPFGAGPRSCIGTRFALMDIKIILASLFRKFSVTVPTELNERAPELAIRTVTIVPAAEQLNLKFSLRD